MMDEDPSPYNDRNGFITLSSAVQKSPVVSKNNYCLRFYIQEFISLAGLLLFVNHACKMICNDYTIFFAFSSLKLALREKIAVEHRRSKNLR